ncbi:MAG: HAMP domain-containing protein [Chloroflexi bacterium]|nr:HAMP domain-containing protein [Chloroflexota bacterium]
MVVGVVPRYHSKTCRMAGLMTPSRFGLQWRITAAVAGGVVVLFLIVGFIAWRTIARSTQAAAHERLSMAMVLAYALDNELDDSLERLKDMTTLPSLADGSLEEQRETLAHLSLSLEGFTSLVLVGGRGEILWPEAPSPAQVPDLHEFERLSDSADLPGAVGASFIWSSNEEDPSKAAGWAVVPVVGEQGEHMGVLLGRLDPSHLGTRAGLPLLADQAVSLAVVSSAGGVLIDLPGHSDAPPGSIKRHLAMLAPFVRNRETGVTIHRTGLLASHVVSFVPLRTVQGGIIVEQRQDAVLAIGQELMKALLLYGGLAVVAVSLVAWLHVTRTVRPIRQLAKATERIAQGQLGEPVLQHRGDEIGILAGQFESMRQSLQAAREQQLRWERELEERVQARTREVHTLLEKVINAQEEERKRIARELHDGATQDLATALVWLRSAAESVPGADPREKGVLESTARRLEETLQGMRSLMLDLRPPFLDDLGLAAAVHWYARHRTEGTRMKTDFRVVGTEHKLGSAWEAAVFRILQEAVTNAVRHSKGRQLEVHLEFLEEELKASVRDDGTGFDPSVVKGPDSEGRGWGLMGMRERASLLGGQLVISTAPHQGTLVQLRLPYRRE